MQKTLGFMMAGSPNGGKPAKPRPITLSLPEELNAKLLQVSMVIGLQENRNITVQEVLRRLAEKDVSAQSVEELAEALIQR